jgi:Trypsin-like peptidase domain/WWE domain
MAQEEDRYSWVWSGDHGAAWMPFDDDGMAQLEVARRAGTDKVVIKNKYGEYEIDLKVMKQTNLRTRTSRDVSKVQARWYWLDDDGRSWRSYVQEDALKLALGQLTLDALGPDSGFHLVRLHRGGNNYEVDLVNRKQKNVDSNVERAIHQGMPQSLKILHRSLRQDDASEALGREQLLKMDSGGSESNLVDQPPLSCCDCLVRLIFGEDDNVTPSQQVQSSKPSPSQHDNFNGVQEEPVRQQPTKHDTVEMEGDSHTLPKDAGTPQEQANPPTKGFTEDYVRSKIKQDTIKVVCLGLSPQPNKPFDLPTDNEGKLGLKHYSWSLQSAGSIRNEGVFCSVFDFVGQDVHYCKTKLFFSSRSVYVIVWDLGATNSATFPQQDIHSFGIESLNMVLERDIFERVQFWVDAIHQVTTDSVVLVVVSLDGLFATSATGSKEQTAPECVKMDEKEIHRRCLVLKRYFQDEQRKSQYEDVLFGPDENPVLQIGGSATNLPESERLDGLKNKLLQLSNDPTLLPDFGKDILSRFVQVSTAVKRLTQDGLTIVGLEQICDSKDEDIKEEVRAALQWLSSTGEILYYGAIDRDLNCFAILDSTWLLKAIKSIQGPDGDVQAAFEVARRNAPDGWTEEFQDLYHGPVAAFTDICLVWRRFLEAYKGETKNSGPVMKFLCQLFIHLNIFIPLEIDGNPSTSKVFYHTGVLRSANYMEFVHFYRNITFSGTSLAQTLQFHTLLSRLVLEQAVAYMLSRVYSKARRGPENDKTEGQLYVKDILFYRGLAHFKFRLYARTSNGDVLPSDVEVYAQYLVAPAGALSIGADFLGESRQKLVIGAKGEGGNGGRIVWKGGYELVSDCTVFFDKFLGEREMNRAFFCPSCLKGDLRKARSWGMTMIEDVLKGGEDELICGAGHRELTHQLLGRCTTASDDKSEVRLPSSLPPAARASALMPGVVMVGLYDPSRQSEKIRKVGSGFIVDKERGLIVTAAHTLMKLDDWGDFGRDFDGIEGAKAVIGVIPSERSPGKSSAYPPAVFRYLAKIYRKDPSLAKLECHVDACILQITGRFKNDVGGNGDLCGEELIDDLAGVPSLMKDQPLKQLVVVERARVGEPVRIFGFDQPVSSRLNRNIEISPGTVLKHVETEGFEGERYKYTPRKKIVLKCPTIVGHSGGPCVNQKGEVIGILSCADFTEKSLCYLAPTSEWIHLIEPGRRSLG